VAVLIFLYFYDLLQDEKPQPSPNTGKKSTANSNVVIQSLSIEAQVQQLKYENDKLKNALAAR